MWTSELPVVEFVAHTATSSRWLPVKSPTAMASGKKLADSDIERDRRLERAVPFAQHHVEIVTVIKGDDIQLAVSIEIPGSDGHGSESGV